MGCVGLCLVGIVARMGEKATNLWGLVVVLDDTVGGRICCRV